MTELVPFAYPQAGHLIVLGDGPELLVFSGSNDQGMWKVMCEDLIMGVGATADNVVSVEADGQITLYRALDGYVLSRLDTRSSPMWMEVSPEGNCAILTASALVLVLSGQDPRSVALATPRVCAWGPGGASLGVGSADGTFTAVDPTSGGAWGSVRLSGAVTGVAWCAQGQWAVAHGTAVSFISGDGAEVLSAIELAEPVGEVAVSADGAVLAVVVSQSRTAVYEMHALTKVGEVLFQRVVHHIRFGPQHWLCFGFEDGDANRLDMLTGSMTRTQAHPGRGQNAWAMQAQINHALVRGAVANVAAGGSAIAVHNKPVIKKKRSKMFLPTVIAAVILLPGVACCGGIGLWLAYPYILGFFDGFTGFW